MFAFPSSIEQLEPRVLLALPKADLIVDFVNGTASSYNVGQRIQAKAGLKNVGHLFSGAFKLRYYLGKLGNDNTRNNTYRRIEVDSVPNMPAGTSRIDSINFPGYQIPSDVPAGEYYITVWADSGHDVAEGADQEQNNLGFSARFAIKHGADLAVSSVSGVNTDGYSPGQRLHAKTTVHNQGNASTFGSFDLRYFLGAADGSNKKLYTIEDEAVPFLNAGLSYTDSINFPGWTIPQSIAQGEYRVWVHADWGAEIVESDERNNWGSSAEFRISSPDLEVSSLTLKKTAFKYNDRLLANAKISNVGGGSTAGPFNISFYLGTVDGSDRQLFPIEKNTVLNLGGGRSSTNAIDAPGWRITSKVPPGAYRVWMKVDLDDEITEANESNNWGSSPVLYLQGAKWENKAGHALGDSIAEATPIYLSLTANNVPHSKVFMADIYENDGVAGNELVKKNVPLRWESGSTWRARWVPYRIKDGGSDPEYFFKVNNSPPGLLLRTSSDLTVTPHAGNFGVQLSHHTKGSGVPMVLVHGNNSDDPEKSYDLYRWKWFAEYIEAHPAKFAEFDVYLWKHDTSKAIGFNGAAGSQAAELANYIYDTLKVSRPGTQYETARVALVAHSQGGLVSRSFMNFFDSDKGRLQGDDVSGLITIGTPHHGSPFAIEDWVAALTADTFGENDNGEGIFETIRLKAMETESGSLNLAWDNMDGFIDRPYVTDFPKNSYTLTARDTNMTSVDADSTLVFTDQIKNTFGTLRALNENEAFYHKLVAIGAYDNSLSDNKSAAAYAAELAIDGMSDHEKLSAVTVLLARMSEVLDGNTNVSTYFANDGLVPLQSSLFLDLTNSSASIASLNLQQVHLNMPVIRSLTRQDVTSHIYTGRIADHQDILDTPIKKYWETITADLRKLLEKNPPTAKLDAGEYGELLIEQLNGARYLDVTFTDKGGSGLDPRSITDAAAEFTLLGPAAANVVVDGAAERIGDRTYRYQFAGTFAPGVVTLRFALGTFADDAGNTNIAAAEAVTVRPDNSLVLIEDPKHSGKKILIFHATAAADEVIFKSVSHQRIELRSNGGQVGVFSDISQIRAYGEDGNDRIFAGSVRVPMQLFGGAGNDHLTGGKGDDTLLGERGRDTLIGGGG